MSEVDALQNTLAGEHAAVWVYGVLGGQTSQSKQPTLYADVLGSYRMHRGRRDTLVRTITDLGADPVAPAVAYELPNQVSSTGQIMRAALAIEERCAATYADLVARTVDAQRQWAIHALTEAAVRQLRFRGSPETFPGANELANR